MSPSTPILSSTPTSVSTVRIRPCDPSDAPILARLQYQALSEYNPLYEAFFNVHPLDSLPISIAATCSRQWERDSALRIFKAVLVSTPTTTANDNSLNGGHGETEQSSAEGTEEIVGFVKWELVNASGQHSREAFRRGLDQSPQRFEQETAEVSSGTVDIKRLFEPKPYLKDLFEEFNLERQVPIDECYEKTMGDQEHLCKVLFRSMETLTLWVSTIPLLWFPTAACLASPALPLSITVHNPPH